jgi:predicted small secreted protein
VDFLIFPSTWRWRRYVAPKRRLTPHLHSATSQKTALFIVTAVKTSNLTIVGTVLHVCHIFLHALYVCRIFNPQVSVVKFRTHFIIRNTNILIVTKMQMFSCGVKNVEGSWIVMESMHVTAKLTLL